MRIRERLRRSAEGAYPLIPIVLTLGAAALVYFGDGQRGSVVGFAQTIPEAAAATEAARITAVHVSVGDSVVAGQILVTLDSGAIDAEIALAHAEKARIQAEVRAEQALLSQRLDADLEALERTVLAEREQKLRAEAEVRALDGEIARVQRLVQDKQAVLSDLSQLNLRHAAVSALVQQKPRTMDVLGKHVQAAEDRRQHAKDRSFALAEKLDADLEVAQRRIERLEQRRATFVLRAASAGRVAAIERRPGEVVAPGEAVVRLVSASGRVVACVPEKLALTVHEGDAARLMVRGQSSTPIEGKTIAVGPVVTELPTRCWLSPRVPVWGREITIAIEGAVDVVPGQAFDVSVELARAKPLGAPSAAAAAPIAPAPAPASSHAPRPITVPPALAARSRLEPSGILARPGESRYLVVSDDTGHEADEGQPWIFAMSPSGVMDPEPVLLAGVSRINDLESITAGDAGEIYLLSSQSYSKKGKRKPSRTAMLRARAEGSGQRVDGEVHLAELLDADPERASALGLPDGTRALDIEGMSFHRGALYLGLKAPLDARGEAMIWRVERPAALFGASRSKLADAGLSLWAHARVDVELGGRPLPGGISDLLFMPDGSLVITSTPSTAEGATGALFRVDRPAPGALAPRLVQRFADLKPEGITPSLTPGRLMIVFDAGDATPSFLDLPWGP